MGMTFTEDNKKLSESAYMCKLLSGAENQGKLHEESSQDFHRRMWRMDRVGIVDRREELILQFSSVQLLSRVRLFVTP